MRKKNEEENKSRPSKRRNCFAWEKIKNGKNLKKTWKMVVLWRMGQNI